MDHQPRREDDVRSMLRTVGVERVDDLFADVPEEVRLNRELALPPALSELELEGIATTRELALDVLSSTAFRSGDYSTSTLADLEGRVPSLSTA